MGAPFSKHLLPEVLVGRDQYPLLVICLAKDVGILRSCAASYTEKTSCPSCRSQCATVGPTHSSTRKRTYAVSTAKGTNAVSSSVRAAKRMQARTSSLATPGYSSMIVSTLSPWASKLRTCSTVSRVPLMTAFPAMTSGFRVMRSSGLRSFIDCPPRNEDRLRDGMVRHSHGSPRGNRRARRQGPESPWPATGRRFQRAAHGGRYRLTRQPARAPRAVAVASVTGRAVRCAMAQRPAQHESAMYAASVRDRMGGCRFALPHPLAATRHDGGSMR